jgi:hypothetical protein
MTEKSDNLLVDCHVSHIISPIVLGDNVAKNEDIPYGRNFGVTITKYKAIIGYLPCQ